MTGKNILQTLADGLIIRTATAEDAEEIANFNGKIHVDPGEEFVQHIYHWVKDLFNGKHPTTRPSDFTVVEDSNTGEIVSTMCYINQEWAYEGIKFPVGRPELVGTLEAYRRRGLIRRQFEIVHKWGDERGHKLQFITGIPWYYRQFGYEMAVNLGGERVGSIDSIPKLKEDQEEIYTFRPASKEDARFIAAIYNHSTKRNLLSCVRDEALWQYEICERNIRASLGLDLQIIEHAGDRTPVGYLGTLPILVKGRVQLKIVEITPGISWFDIAHPLLRQLKTIGEGYIQRDSTEENPLEMTGYSFELGGDHPLYKMIPNRMPKINHPYAYYLRVPDLTSFLQGIVPVMEEHLAGSYMCGHSGELKLNFYKSGILIKFKKGKISIENWDKPHFESASANFPEQTFIQLLFGHRSVDDLDKAFPDIYFPKEEARYLLNTLFPHKPSNVIALG